MATQSFGETEANFVVLSDKFQLALRLTKLCARSCGVLNINNPGFSVSQKEKDCLNICSNNISKTYPSFLNKVKETLDLPLGEGGSEEAEE